MDTYVVIISIVTVLGVALGTSFAGYLLLDWLYRKIFE